MTDITADTVARSEESMRIERMVAEAGKLNEETRKFVAEQHKLLAEQAKLLAEAEKLQRDHGFAPYALALGAVGGGAGLIVALSSLLKNLGVF